jgi:hypothetical protein
METHRDDLDLIAELRALRPSPTATFAEELDSRVAAGFAKPGRCKVGLLGRIEHALRSGSPRRLALPAGAVALAALIVATAVIATSETGNEVSAPHQVVDPRRSVDETGADHSGVQFSDTPRTASGLPSGAEKAASGAGFQSSSAPVAPTSRHRAVERDAELVLSTEPGEMGEASKEVFGVVHAADGVVLSSSVRDERNEASARFELLIPAASLGDTLASLSRIAVIRSRHESTSDITASTVDIGVRLEDSEATIEGMLTQLASAESYGERSILERQLRHERRHAAALRTQLERLRQRARFARVSLRIESGATSGAGSASWGVDDALDDASRVLAIAAGVAVIGLAVVAPIALLALLAWLANRAWLRFRRERALG